MYDGKIIVLIYLLAVFFSYLYTVIFNTYNGDFFQGTVLLSFLVLSGNSFILSYRFRFVKNFLKLFLRD